MSGYATNQELASDGAKDATVRSEEGVAQMKKALGFSVVSVMSACILFSTSIFLSQHATKSEASPHIILEVIDKHFTMGRQIPSVYLRVFSDGTAECHALRDGHEPHVVKRKTLTPDELSKLKAVLENPELLNVQKRYELLNLVIDSWTEWNIAIPRDVDTQRIQVLNFSPGSQGEKKKPYPDALVKLGCLSRLPTTARYKRLIYTPFSPYGRATFSLESEIKWRR